MADTTSSIPIQQPLINNVEQSQEEKKSSVPSAIFNLVKSITGAGIVMLPMALSHVGYGLGTLLLILFGCLSAVSCNLLKIAFDHTKERTYSSMGGKLFGKGFAIFIDVLQIIYSFFSVIGYLVVVADEFYLTVSYFFLNVEIDPNYEWMLSRTFIFIVVTLLFILPPCLFKRLDSLKFTSFIAMGFIAYLTLVMLIKTPWESACELAFDANYTCAGTQCIIESNSLIPSTGVTECIEQCELGDPTADSRLDLHAFLFSTLSFLALPFFGFSNCCQVQFVPILAELKNPTTKRVNIVVYSSFFIVFLIYFLNAIAGYWSFCGFSTNNILDSYDVSDIYILLSRIAISFTLCFTIPLFTHPMRDMFFQLINFKPKYIHQALVSVVVLAISVFVAIVFPKLDIVLGINGAIGSSTLMLIVPGLMYYKITSEEKGMKRVFSIILSVFMILLGLFFMVMGTYTTFAH